MAKAKSSTNVVDGEQQPSVDDKNKSPRHPRWSRHETMVLIEGKKVAEERGRRGRRSSSVFGGSDNFEPKWDYVSSHCRQNGVNRGPVQCRKRWSNLLSDFKKIKNWESVKGGGESFWMMRSDLRREIKLPGFFDREIYDVLDGKPFTMAGYQLALVTTDEFNGDGEDDGDGGDDEEVAEEEEMENVESDGKTESIPSPVPISEMRYQPYYQAESSRGPESKRRWGPYFQTGSEFQEGMKRRKWNSCQDNDATELLLKAIERNTNLLNAKLEEQRLNSQLERGQQKDQHNTLIAALTKITDEQRLNSQLEREQQKDRHDTLIAALTKITDALEKIANKL